MKPSRPFSPDAVTRRAFLKRVAITGGAFATAGAIASPIAAALQKTGTAGSTDAAAASSIRAAPAPVVAFFDGQLWLDPSGASIPYRAPGGARGAAPLAELTDEALRGAHIWL